MEKINFENLPSTNTPINASNLNTLQDNIEASIDEKPNALNTKNDSTNDTYSCDYINNKTKIQSLWQGKTSVVGSYTLSDEITNYDFILAEGLIDSYSKGSLLIPVSTIVYSNGDNYNHILPIFRSTSLYGSIGFTFVDSTHISIKNIHIAGWSITYLTSIIGIKL